ncbi:MAG: phosphatase PAP2 family protein [bacterium]|jgi:hypothetical protein|nr:phosphatase PAP2 family protein [Betaproteobacteria bacterium]
MPERARTAAGLPLLRTRTGKYAAALLVALACAALYILPGRIAAGHAQVIALFDWERRIPWIPQTVWPYLAQYPLLVASYASCRDLVRCTRFLYAVLLAQAVAALLFVAWPLRYPREAFAAAWPPDALTAAVAGWVRAIDAPVNCLPSLHVTSCLFCMLLVGAGRTPGKVACHAVALASIASTLTFKQHYAIDLPAGAALALAAWWLAGRAMPPGRAMPDTGTAT